MTSYQEAAHLRAFMYTLGAVFARTPEEADAIATEHRLWGRRPDDSWSADAAAAFNQLCADQQAAYRYLARTENARARVALMRKVITQRPVRIAPELHERVAAREEAKPRPKTAVVTRPVGIDERHNYLGRAAEAGERFTVCTVATYGSVNTDGGIALSEQADGGYPFFEFPLDAVRIVNGGEEP